MSTRYSILLGKKSRKLYKPELKIFREGQTPNNTLKLGSSVCHSCEYPGVSDPVWFVCSCGIAWKNMNGMTREQWNEWYGK
jgi:hypothetical protein